MKRSQRGAVRVSIVWMVTTLVLFFVALFVAYAGYDAAAKSEQQLIAIKGQLAEGEKRWEADRKSVSDLSTVVGWTDPNAASPSTNLEALNTDFQDLRNALGAGSDVKELRGLVAYAKGQLQTRGRELAGKDEEISQLKQKSLQTEQALRDSLREKDAQAESLRRQLSDQTDAATQKQSEYEKRIAELRNQNSQLDADLRRQTGDAEAAARKHQEEIRTLETRLAIQGQKLRFLKEPQAVDAKVLAVSKDLALAWIDIGARQRLARGTRFTITSGRSGSSTTKAMCEVTAVEPDRAEVRLYDLKDNYDPVVPGDTLYNPVYDPKGERFAVLAGRFSGKYNEKELKDLLALMGISVQPQLDLNTDYLIVGGEMFADAEGNPVETPIQPSDLPVYKEAESKGVQIMAVKDLQGYFAF